jgi:hypothetical protein
MRGERADANDSQLRELANAQDRVQQLTGEIDAILQG